MNFSRLIIFGCVSTFTALPVIAETVEDAYIIACPLPQFDEIQSDSDLGKNELKITSKSSEIKRNHLAKFSGGVTLLGQNQKVVAEDIEINQQTYAVNAIGNIEFQNQGINILADKFVASQASNATTLSDTSYQLIGNAGHGAAGSIEISGEGSLSLKDSTYTTCYGEKPAWQIEADEIRISAANNSGEAIGAKFKLYDVPVMYVPYFYFPVTNERKTGFLDPKLGSSSNSGVKIETPFYWNIAENMDATITPHYMSKRGVQLMTEFRYLTGLQSGKIDLEYLNKDKDVKSNDDARYLARFQHTGTFADNFRAYVDYATISDDNYLVDIGSDQYNSNDAYLYQVGELSYFNEAWQASIKLQDFEVLGDNTPSYKTIPQVEFSYEQGMPFANGIFDIYSEVSRFESQNLEQNDAERYHVEAGMTFPIATPAWFLNSELRLMQTNYKQIDIAPSSELEETVSRTLPKARFHGGINFDRPMYWNSNFTQTFEPQLQYLYVPDEDQSMIGIYDTTQLQDDYNGLFRDTRYSGLDRIAQANQLSWGVTSRVLNATNQELFRFSFGQIIYFNDSNIGLQNNDSSDQVNAEESALAADIFYQINDQWQFSGDIQYDTQNSVANKSQINIYYLHSKNNLVQLNHRYTRDVSGNTLEQLSLLSSVRINHEWQLVGRITQDIQEKRSLESYAGIQYESCCWAIQLAYHRHINSYFEEPDNLNENRNEFESGFMLKFIMKGLSKQSLVDATNMLDSSIFGYKRPYFLTN